MKIAFIHNNAKTGATAHAIMLAKRLQEKMEVVFLVCNLIETGADFSILKNVREFSYSETQRHSYANKWPLHVSLLVRLRMLLFHLRLLRPLDKITPLWQPFRTMEKQWLFRHSPLPKELEEYLRQHDGEFDAYVILGNFTGPAFHLKEKYAHKTVLIPLVHMEMPQFILSVHDISRRYPFLAFNTSAERRLCHRIHDTPLSAPVIGSGIEISKQNPETWNTFLSQHPIHGDYLLYVGRITRRKTGHLFDYFTRYKQKHPSPLKLIVAGDSYLSSAIRRDDIIFLGFVSETLKNELIHHAAIVINPSQVESLSLIVLEAMHAGVPIVVNGKCEVLKDHCDQSHAGMYYTDYSSFEQALDSLLPCPSLRITLGQNGQAYEAANYSWPVILQKWENLLTCVSEANH